MKWKGLVVRGRERYVDNRRLEGIVEGDGADGLWFV